MPGPLKRPLPFRRKGKKIPGQGSDDDLGLDLRIRVVDRPSSTIINKEFIQVGNVGRGDYIEIDHDSLSLFGDSLLKMDIQTDGDLFIGSDVSAPGTTYFSIFSNNQTYNTESVKAGDMLIGDNSSGKANIYWDESEGQLLFRGGKTAELYVDTDGSLVAGAGDVLLDSGGLTLTPGTEGTKKIKTVDGGTRIAEIYGWTDPGAASELVLLGRGRGGSGPVTHEGRVSIVAITDDGTPHAGAASVTFNLETDNDTASIVAGTFRVNGAAIYNEGGGDYDFRIESDNKAHIFFVDASADCIGIGTSSPDSDAIIDIGSAGKPIILPVLTSAEIGSLTAVEGMLVYNSTDGAIDYYDGSSWLQLSGT